MLWDAADIATSNDSIENLQLNCDISSNVEMHRVNRSRADERAGIAATTGERAPPLPPDRQVQLAATKCVEQEKMPTTIQTTAWAARIEAR